MATDNVPTILVPVIRNKDGIDVNAMLREAEKIVKQYQADDKAATSAVAKVTENILGNEKYAKMTAVTPGTLAKMALSLMGEIPTDKLCAETEVRVKAYLQGQPEKFLFIPRGRNSGFHFKERLSAEELAKLQKEKATAEATK